jgi:hypothetical protein
MLLSYNIAMAVVLFIAMLTDTVLLLLKWWPAHTMAQSVLYRYSYSYTDSTVTHSTYQCNYLRVVLSFTNSVLSEAVTVAFPFTELVSYSTVMTVLLQSYCVTHTCSGYGHLCIYTAIHAQTILYVVLVR